MYHPDRILITDGSESGKTNALLKLIKQQIPDITKSLLYIKETLESKYQLLMNGTEQVRMENLKIPKAFIDYSRQIDIFHENLDD